MISIKISGQINCESLYYLKMQILFTAKQSCIKCMFYHQSLFFLKLIFASFFISLVFYVPILCIINLLTTLFSKSSITLEAISFPFSLKDHILSYCASLSHLLSKSALPLGPSVLWRLFFTFFLLLDLIFSFSVYSLVYLEHVFQ